MKMFPGLSHPDQVDELPAVFVSWAFEFERIETEVRAEAEKAARKG